MIRYLIPLLLLAAAVGCSGDSRPAPAGLPPAPPPDTGQALDPAQRLDKTMQELTPRLKLKPEQAVQVKQILKKGEDQKAALFAQCEASNNPQEMAKTFEQVHQVDLRTQTALSKVLSKDQMEGYQEYLEQQRKRFETGKRSKSKSGKSDKPLPTKPVGKPGSGM
jgi:hypothetical protein